jgi:hypothetical protein
MLSAQKAQTYVPTDSVAVIEELPWHNFDADTLGLRYIISIRMHHAIIEDDTHLHL